MKKVLIATIFYTALYLSLLYPANEVVADERSDAVDRLVRGLPRGATGIPIYWFEMRTVIGWERMILVLSYADNRAVCHYIKDLAYKDSPGREFRCTAAN